MVLRQMQGESRRSARARLQTRRITCFLEADLFDLGWMAWVPKGSVDLLTAPILRFSVAKRCSFLSPPPFVDCLEPPSDWLPDYSRDSV